MKAVFLTLLLGLVCAAQEAPAQPESPEVPKFCWCERRSWFCECDRERQSWLHGWQACVCTTHILWYTYLHEHNTTPCLPARCIFFFSSYLSVCKRKKANMLSFRELWTVMVFNGVVLAISRNSKFFLLEYESLLHFTVIIALLLLHYSAR